MSRQFDYGVAFHGFDREEGDADVYVGGAASHELKEKVENALNGLGLTIRVKISTPADPPKFQGFSPDKIINQLALQDIHIEQSAQAKNIALAVVEVFVSHGDF